MSILSELGTEAVAALKAVGVAAENFVISEADKAILFLKANEPLVTKTLNLMSDLENSTVPVTERMAKVIADIEDEAVEFLKEGGLAGIESSIPALLLAFGQSAFTDLKNDLAAI